ncbi:MAG: radical SAM protein [Candidatus Paceibacterota bacterium]|jgi:hypothetical protein
MEKYVIEPLGIQHLLSIAKMLGWDAEVYLHQNSDFEPLINEAKGADLVGFSIWTGAHEQAFRAADILREKGVLVAIGGPHATYHTDECARHADWVAKGDSFRIWKYILQNISGAETLPVGVRQLSSNVLFDENARAEEFPLSNLGREIVYHRYPDLAKSHIKSIMGSTGCPFHCTYCNSPHLNEMYKKQGGFKHVFRVRPLDDIIAEALYVRDHWGVKMFYFQDDIFGYDLSWLREFVRRWKSEVGVSWHCQIRLELTRGKPGEERLDLFVEGGCSGITLAIESGNAFLRELVLLRPMEHELIVGGCHEIMRRGMTLRTEQMLQIPFSNLETDLSTLQLNHEINPTMAWSSILHPFGETNMGKIARQWGFWSEDSPSSIYWNRSPLLHSTTAMETVLPHIERLRPLTGRRFDSPLLRMYTESKNGNGRADVFVEDGLVHLSGVRRVPICEIQYLDAEANERYCDQTSHLQPIFNWLSKVPRGYELGWKWVELRKEEWTFANLGKLTEEHLRQAGHNYEVEEWKRKLADGLWCSPDSFPAGIRDNPLYFCFFPSGPKLARTMIEKGVFSLPPEKFWHEFGSLAR